MAIEAGAGRYFPNTAMIDVLEEKKEKCTEDVVDCDDEGNEICKRNSSSCSDPEFLDEEIQDQFLVKPMPRLQVCPVDDLAVEEEKRRRRSKKHHITNGKNKRLFPDAESLPNLSHQGPVGTKANIPQLRRDPMAIRHQYWKQLGFNLSRTDLERSTGRRHLKHEGLKVSLNDSNRKKGDTKTIFQLISGWYGLNSSSNQSIRYSRNSRKSEQSSTVTSESSSTEMRKRVVFSEEAELFYIPIHKDYPKRQRDGMWHTREEFVAMVEKNLDEVYDEMEREYEVQLQMELLENQAMTKEEAYQRKYEQLAKQMDSVRVIQNQQSFNMSPSPALKVNPRHTQIKLPPRGRSPHEIRFKYLKHLGINN
jgi:hypothetical protein